MGRENDLRVLINSVKCLIVFENKTCLLYQDLAERVESPLIKSLLLHVSLDGQKHSTVLKGIAVSMPKTDWKPTDLPKKMSDTWRSIDDFQVELSGVETIPEETLLDLFEQLVTLERVLAEEYDVLLQINTLELFSEEIGNFYHVSLEALKTILFELLHDEEYHKKLLRVIASLIEKSKEEFTVDNTPTVRFRNPDAWSRPTPITA